MSESTSEHIQEITWGELSKESFKISISSDFTWIINWGWLSISDNEFPTDDWTVKHISSLKIIMITWSCNFAVFERNNGPLTQLSSGLLLVMEVIINSHDSVTCWDGFIFPDHFDFKTQHSWSCQSKQLKHFYYIII